MANVRNRKRHRLGNRARANQDDMQAFIFGFANRRQEIRSHKQLLRHELIFIKHIDKQMSLILFGGFQIPQNFRRRRFTQQQMAVDIARGLFADVTQDFNAMQVARIAFRAVFANHENLVCQKRTSKKQIFFVLVIFFVMDKVPINIATAHNNNRAFVALERAQDTFELMAST